MILGFKVEDCDASRKYVNDVLMVNTNKQPNLEGVKNNVDLKWRQAQGMAGNPFSGSKILSKKLKDKVVYLLSLDFVFPDFGSYGLFTALLGLLVGGLFNFWVGFVICFIGLFVFGLNGFVRSKMFLLFMLKKALQKHKYKGEFVKVSESELVDLFVFGVNNETG